MIPIAVGRQDLRVTVNGDANPHTARGINSDKTTIWSYGKKRPEFSVTTLSEHFLMPWISLLSHIGNLHGCVSSRPY